MLPLLLLACVDPARIAAAEASTVADAPARPTPPDAPAADTGDTAGGWRMVQNPVLDGDRPDPHVLRTVEADGAARYWLVSTPGSGADIPVWTSSDLASWELASPGLFGVTGTPGDSIALNGWHYCNVWAPELAELGPDSYLLTFTATRYAEPQAPCPAYAEDGGVYQAWSRRPTGPFLDAERPWEPLPAGAQIGACALRDTLPRSLDRATVGCVGDECQNVMRLDSTVFVDDRTQRWWMAYAWYTNAPPLVPWETGNLGEHVSLVELDPADPFAVRCDAEVPRVHAANPHDAPTRARLAESCEGCDTMLDNGRGRYDEAMVRAGHPWGVAEAPTLLRRGDLVYLFVSGGTWDSAFYHVYWVAAPSVEELSWENPDRLAGRFLLPSGDQSFGHGTVVLGPDGNQFYMVHHRLRHDACVAGDCARDVWLTPLDFEDRGDGRGDVWVVPRWPAEGTEVAVAMP